MNRVEAEVFRAGDYGGKGVWTPEDLERVASDYDPKVHEAPVTLDHRDEGPAFGWVKGLKVVGDTLVAALDVVEDLERWIRDGLYRKVSVELYRELRETGRAYLRAVSFLGAQVPEVKGLEAPVLFAEGLFDVVDEVDKVDGVDGRKLENTDGHGRTGTDTDGIDKTEITEKEDMNMAEKTKEQERIEALEAEVQSERLGRQAAEDKARLTETRFSEKKQAEFAEQARQNAVAFCETHIEAGYVTPAQVHCGLVELLTDLALSDKVITFGEDSKARPVEILKAVLTQHKAVTFSEIAPNKDRPVSEVLAFAEKARAAGVSPEQYAKAVKAVAGHPHLTPELYIRANPDEFKN